MAIINFIKHIKIVIQVIGYTDFENNNVQLDQGDQIVKGYSSNDDIACEQPQKELCKMKKTCER